MNLPAAAAAGLATVAVALAACGGGGGDNGQPRGTITVFAAASLTEAFGELADAFETAHPGVTVRLSFSGSATLRTQVLEGAPADVFASASPYEVEELDAAGLVIEERRFAANSLVVAAAEGATGISSFGNLAEPSLRLVLAAEDVPAGRYARELVALVDLDGAFGSGFAERVFANVRSNETNVRAALAKVELGEADAAIVYTTDLAAADGVRAVAVPDRFPTSTEYRIALLAESEMARAFVGFVTSPEGAAILARHGFWPLGPRR